MFSVRKFSHVDAMHAIRHIIIIIIISDSNGLQQLNADQPITGKIIIK